MSFSRHPVQRVAPVSYGYASIIPVSLCSRERVSERCSIPSAFLHHVKLDSSTPSRALLDLSHVSRRIVPGRNKTIPSAVLPYRPVHEKQLKRVERSSSTRSATVERLARACLREVSPDDATNKRIAKGRPPCFGGGQTKSDERVHTRKRRGRKRTRGTHVERRSLPYHSEIDARNNTFRIQHPLPRHNSAYRY